MQANCDDVAACRGQAERCGNLLVLVCKDGKQRKQPEAAPHICRLSGNLLFLTRGIDLLSQECDLLIVLEACKVQVDYTEIDSYSFRLVFDFEPQTVLFKANSDHERSSWVAAMQNASILHLQAELESTRQQIQRITGRDPLQKIGPDSEQQQQLQQQSEECDSGLELQLAIRQLPQLSPNSNSYPNAQVQLFARTPPVKDWYCLARTDVVSPSTNCCTFRRLLIVPDSHYSQLTHFEFRLFDVRDSETATVQQLCTFTAKAESLVDNGEVLLQPDASTANPADAGVSLSVCVRHRESGSQLQQRKGRHAQMLWHMCCNDARRLVSQSYQLEAESGRTLKVREYLCDLKCSMHIPMQLASMWEKRLSVLCNAISSLGVHNCPHQDLMALFKLAQEEKQLQTQVALLRQEVKDCAEEANRRLFDGDFVKLSRLRAVPNLAFVPPNAQLHRLCVLDDKDKVLDFHDIISMGAPASHHLKLKKAGLLTVYRTCPALEEAAQGWECALQLLDEGELLEAQTLTLISKVRSTGAADSQLVADNDCKMLLDLVENLICQASDCLIVQARIELGLDCIGLQQLNHQLKMVRDAVINQDNCDSLSSACDSLQAEVQRVWQQCKLTLAKHCLAEAARLGGDLLLTGLRRRMCNYSQLLTACVCGVLAHFSRWSESNWRLMQAVGMPVYFESLLSTYKAEAGMLEDAVASVRQLEELELQFFPGNSGDQPIIVTAQRVRVCVPNSVWARLDPSLQVTLSSAWFSVVPIMFNVGINEEQTLADKQRLAAANVQRELNRSSAQRLKQLVDSAILKLAAGFETRSLNQSEAADASVEQQLRDRMQELLRCIEEDKTKPVALLHAMQRIAWLLEAPRITNCKSGKDRTAMSVTLEQASWLRDTHRLLSLEQTAAFLREHGLRRKNCFRNIGTPFYAFNRVQLTAFPQLYRPPKGTYQRGPT